MNGRSLPRLMISGLMTLSTRRHDERAPGEQEDSPAGLAVNDEPEAGGNPDQRRTDRHRRQEERDEPQQRRRLDAGEPEADRHQHALRERGAEDAEDDAAHGRCGDDRRARARARRRCGSTAARTRSTIASPSRKKKNAMKIDSASCSIPPSTVAPLATSDLARRLEVLAHLVEQPRRVVRERRPVRGRALADERQPRDPAGGSGGPSRPVRCTSRQRWSAFSAIVTPTIDERRQHGQRNQQHHHQRGERRAAAEPVPRAHEQRPRRRAQDGRPDDRRQKRLQHEEAVRR